MKKHSVSFGDGVDVGILDEASADLIPESLFERTCFTSWAAVQTQREEQIAALEALRTKLEKMFQYRC